MSRRIKELLRNNVVNSTLPPEISPKPNLCAKELNLMDVCQSERCEATWMSVCTHVCLCVCMILKVILKGSASWPSCKISSFLSKAGNYFLM